MRRDYRHSVILRKRLRMQVERYRWELLRKALPSLHHLPSGAWKRHIRSIVLRPTVYVPAIWTMLNLQRWRGK